MIRTLITAVVVMATAPAVLAATISGTVHDASTSDLHGIYRATVIAIHPSTEEELTTTTDRDGSYSIDGLPADGQVKMKFRKATYHRDPTEETATMASGEVKVHAYLMPRTHNRQQLHQFAENLREASTAADQAVMTSLRQLYDALPKDSKDIVDEELKKNHVDLKREKKEKE